jgi:hypothetical protein
MNGPGPNVTDVVVGALAIVVVAIPVLDWKLPVSANVAVALHVVPALTQSPEYEIVGVPATVGLTEAVAETALPLYTNPPGANAAVVTVGALVMVRPTLLLLGR